MADKDLDFLYQCSNAQLKLLADFMLYDRSGKLRSTKQISSTKAFKLYYPHEMVKLVPALIDELQNLGGNIILNFFKGHGLPYREILKKVCKKLEVPYSGKTPMEVIERNMLKKLFAMSVGRMTEEDLRHLRMSKDELTEMVKNEKHIIFMAKILVAQLASLYGKKADWIPFAGRGVIAGGFAGPINFVLIALLLSDIVKPAYRVIIPCTIVIAYLRVIYNTPEFEGFNGADPVLDPILVK